MIEFEYNGKLFYATKLEKKLKKLKINREDITIIREYDETKKQDDNAPDDSVLTVYTYNPETHETYISVITDKKKPTPEELFNNWLWDEETKTGVNRFTEETLKKLIVLDGKPKYPLCLGDDLLPILEKIYDWDNG